MTYTAKQVEDAIAKWQAAEDDEDYDHDGEYVNWDAFEEKLTDWGWEDGTYRTKLCSFEIPDLGMLTALVVDGGGEGHGEYTEMVFGITAPDGAEQVFRKEGYYASFHGGDWDGDLFEVFPVDRVVRFYEKMPAK
ncbi:hypothetical protein [Nocardia jiangxiensis]|uniref:hypothetical protein n=1 Tax=Nocardia jiangxiensis TaxID=282685 RepID=UPI00030EFCDE|nr:hypothetical protein [Nocardia jiangxiensis]